MKLVFVLCAGKSNDLFPIENEESTRNLRSQCKYLSLLPSSLIFVSAIRMTVGNNRVIAREFYYDFVRQSLIELEHQEKKIETDIDIPFYRDGLTAILDSRLKCSQE